MGNKWPFGYIDLLLSLTSLLFSMLFFVILSVNPKAKANPDAMPPPGNIAVLMCWAAGPTDVDLWLGAPGDKPVGYSRKSGLVWALLRDDMGVVNDVSPINCESAFARATPAGDYAVNIHGYSLPEAINIHIEISLNGALLVSENMDLRPRQERTVARFSLDGQGKIVPGSVNRVLQPLRSAQ